MDIDAPIFRGIENHLIEDQPISCNNRDIGPSHKFENAGKVSIVRGEFAQVGPSTDLGWYLKFVPNAAFSGTINSTG